MKIENINELLNPTEQVGNLTLKILGLGLVRLGDDEQLKVFFPATPHHPFKMIVSKFISFDEVAKSEFNLPTGSVVEFSPKSIKAPSEIDESVNDDSVNLGLLHKKEHNEDLVLTDKLENYLGFLNLNGTTLMSQKMTNQKNFEIWDKMGGTKTRIGKKDLGNFLWASYSIDSAEVTKIQIKKPMSFDLDLSFEEVDVRYEITFSSDCEGVACNNVSDVQFFYNIIDTQRLKGTFEFVMSSDEKAPDGSCSPGTGGRIAIPPTIGSYSS